METDLYRDRDSDTSDNIESLVPTTFNKSVFKGSGPIVVEFMSYACSHCGTLEPILQKVAEMLRSKVKIFRLNTAIEKELSSKYEIEATPTLIMFLNGRVVGRIEGPNPSVSSLLTAMAQPFRRRS